MEMLRCLRFGVSGVNYPCYESPLCVDLECLEVSFLGSPAVTVPGRDSAERTLIISRTEQGLEKRGGLGGDPVGASRQCQAG